MPRPKEKPPCSVCAERGDGAHFGAEACRACAAFFRRSVALRKTYVCRTSKVCSISTGGRCMCRACRFEKCLSVGMQKTAVQRHRDMIGRRKEGLLNSAEFNHVQDIQIAGKDTNMPILNSFLDQYNKLEEKRHILHREQSCEFEKTYPKAICYKEANKINVKEIPWIIEVVVKTFPDFQTFESSQKKLLFGAFYLPFMLLETGYFATIKDRSDILYLPSGDYVDARHPETFYVDNDGKQEMSTEEAVRIFAPSFNIYRRNILDPMRDLRITNYEFLAMCCFCLWDHGLEGQTRECEIACDKIRKKVVDEISYYHKHIMRCLEPSSRLASLFVLLPALQRAVRRFQEDVEISNVFNAYSVDDEFYAIVNGRL
ncbi:unnamed protein product [Auanema sp. JU1783]|nr:unnamed protein product [Auanema sp. JU1783]